MVAGEPGQEFSGEKRAFDAAASTGARNGNRTRMPDEGPRILSPLRLPISPSGPRRIMVFRHANGLPREPVWQIWRRDRESNPARRICNPLHNRFAIAPGTALRPPFSAKKKGSRSFPVFGIWSGIRGSNSRPIPWQGIALPTELIPRGCLSNRTSFAQ